MKNLRDVLQLPNVEFIKGDIRSADLLNLIFKSKEINTVMHFAAQSHVDNSFGNSFDFTKNNIEGTHTLLEASRLAGTVEKFLHVSTDEVYGESSFELDASNTEHASLLAPTNPYSATKAGAEMLVMAYGRSYGLPFTITRGNNVYGPGQYPEKAIPKFSILASRKKQIALHGDGLATRSYMHVNDAASAFDTILHHGCTSHVYNIGAHEERTILSVARDVCRITGCDVESSITFVRDRAFNDRRYFIDCSKLLALGWKQTTSWEEGLNETIIWYSTQDLYSYWPNFEAALQPHPVANAAYVSPLPKLDNTSPCDTPVVLCDSHAPPATFLIYGKNGWIGGMLGRMLVKKDIPHFFGSARLQNREDIERDIMRYRPTHIICAAGLTGRPNVDWCETNKRAVVQSNVLGALNLMDVANSRGIHLTNFGTGCIYQYDDAHPIGGPGFTEEEPPNFRESYYSKTKAVLDDILPVYDNVLHLRIRMPIDDNLTNPRNFIAKIAKYNHVINVPNSMTVLNELIPVAIDAAMRELTGTYNFTNPGVISHNEVLQLYKEYCDPDFTWKNFSLAEQSRVLLVGRCNNSLDTKKLQRAFPEVLDIKASLIKHVFEVNRARGTKI